MKGKGFGAIRPHPGSFFDDFAIDHRVLHAARDVSDVDVPDADVVVATWWATAGPVSRLSPSKGAPVYLLQHDERVFDFLTDDDKRAVESTWRLPMLKVAVARWIGELVEQHGGGPVHVVHNAVDTSLFDAPARGKQPVPTVGLVYAAVRFKGLDVMLEACRLAQQRLPALKVVAFGREGVDARLPLPTNTVFEPNPSQGRIVELYGMCDAWLFGSRSEGFGLPLLEAMACRTPVIATPAGAAPELLLGGGGWSVPYDDPGAMADRMVEAGTMADATWREVSDCAYATAGRHRWDEATDRFEALLREAAGVGASTGV